MKNFDTVRRMVNVASWPAREGEDAEHFIAAAWDAEDGSRLTLDILQEKKGVLEAPERQTVEAYIEAMRPIYAQMIVCDFHGNTAGLYDGSVMYIDRSLTQVGDSVEETIAKAQEVFDHETYHLEHDHTAPLTVLAKTKGDIAAVIGGVEFTETALIEGLTVKQTGDQFVSEEYVEYENMINRAMTNAHLTVGDFEEAVNVRKNVADLSHVVPLSLAA